VKIDPDISVASTLEGRFYSDEAMFARLRERVFARTWQRIGDLADVSEPQSLAPRTLLAGFMDEPLLLARDAAGRLRCLSNVCTHRGNILVTQACHAKEIRCGYHSRRFDLDGRMTFMPEFKEARDFPSAADNLPAVALGEWAGLGFASLDPAAPFDDFLGDVRASAAALPLAEMRLDPARSRDYAVRAHWALYVENYLEGFHIPFVHKALNEVVDYGSYETRLHRYSNVQLARAKDGAPSSDGVVIAQYWWIFPNLMLNFYPWGLSLNCVEPLAVDRTRVAFRAFVRDRAKPDQGAGASLDRVEAEDEAIVEAVQRGVHHFHRLLCEFLRGGAEPLQ